MKFPIGTSTWSKSQIVLAQEKKSHKCKILPCLNMPKAGKRSLKTKKKFQEEFIEM